MANIIKNAGYLWHRKYVDWQHGCKLQGTLEGNEKIETDFAYQAGVYALYDNNFNCVYVGQAGRGENVGLYHRLRDHAVEDFLFCRWERFSWFGFYPANVLDDDKVDDLLNPPLRVNDLMDVIESMILLINKPSLNKALGKISGIEWYYQKEEFSDN